MLYSEQLRPGLLVNRASSPTSVSSQATSSTCQEWKTAMQMHCLALLQFIGPQSHPQLHPQPQHHHHRFKSHHPCPVQVSPSLPLQDQLSTPDFDFSVLPPLQLSCPLVQAILGITSLQVLTIPYRDSTVLCDVSSSSVRPLVTISLRKQLFSTLHGISHPGVLGF